MARFMFEDEAPAPAASRFVFEDETPAAASPAARFVFEDDGQVPVGRGESFVRGALQGATLGFGDELAGAMQAARPGYVDAVDPYANEAPVVPEGPKGETFGERYRNARDEERAMNAQAQQANPGTYFVGSVAGSAPVAMATGGAGVARQGAGLGARALAGARAAAPLGAVYGAGASEAETLGGVARDTAVGGAGSALLGAAAPAVGAVARRVLAPVVRKGAALVAKGTQRAKQQAAEEGAAAVASLEGAARERAANAYRQMERIELALKNPALPQAERAALEAFKASPEYAALVEANARGVLASAPSAAAEREAAAVIAQEARQGIAQTIQSRASELLKPQAAADARSYLKAYAEPLAWAYAGNKVGEWAGLDTENRLLLAGAAGLVGGRTRAGKALVNRLTRPAHLVAIGNALRRIGSPPAVPPSATQAAAVGLDPEVIALLNALRGRPGFAPAVAEEEDR